MAGTFILGETKVRPGSYFTAAPASLDVTFAMVYLLTCIGYGLRSGNAALPCISAAHSDLLQKSDHPSDSPIYNSPAGV